jgi:prepilin-type N-terminal cleavage/methylation domain-containing protein
MIAMRTRPSSPPAAPRRRREGFTLVEIMAAAVMLAVAMSLMLELVGWVARERRASERRQRAVQEAANVMERLTARAWDDLDEEGVAGLELSPPSRKALPGGELKVAVAAAEGTGLKRVEVSVRWRNRSGEPEAPVRLVSWVSRRGTGGRP